MQKLISFFFSIFGPRDWTARVDSDQPRMIRWRDGRWERRDMTPDEIAEAREWQSIK